MSTATETPDLDGAFPRLTDSQIAVLAARGERRPVQAADVLFRAGEPVGHFFVVLAGLVAIIDDYGADERVVRVHGPGRFLGEIGLLEGQASFLTAVVREPGEVLADPHGIAELAAAAYAVRLADKSPKSA